MKKNIDDLMREDMNKEQQLPTSIRTAFDQSYAQIRQQSKKKAKRSWLKPVSAAAGQTEHESLSGEVCHSIGHDCAEPCQIYFSCACTAMPRADADTEPLQHDRSERRFEGALRKSGHRYPADIQVSFELYRS